MKDSKIGTLLHKNGIRKLRGVSPLTLFSVIFSLPFEGVNFSKGIVKNPNLGFGKDAAYDFLKNPKHNWRNLKGFKLLTLGWSDGNSFLPLDFVLCSSTNEEKRLQGINKDMDKRCCGYKRRPEAMTKSTGHLEAMVKRAISSGVGADYILMDSWFCFPVILATLGRHLPVICMAKDMKTVLCQHKGQWVRLSKLYSLLRKRPGKAKILTSAVVETKQGQNVKIVFVRNHNKKGQWLAIISTDTCLSNEDSVRIYDKRWDIEMFFKVMKSGFHVEACRLGHADRLARYLTVMSIVAWRPSGPKKRWPSWDYHSSERMEAPH